MSENPGKFAKLWSRVAPLVRGAMNCKVIGALGELAFVLKAASLGFGVSKPHADNERYDFIVDSGKRLSRVQVKTTFSRFHRGYRITSEGYRHSPYKSSEIDFLVVYIAPRDIWYVIPVNCLNASNQLTFYPDGCRSGGNLEAYREAWHLLAGYALASSLPKK
jgi:PD-(D/E)XK nuclease superfamily protein